MSTISDALKKAGEKVAFLVQLDLNGLIKRYTNRPGGISVPNSGGDDPFFEGKILNELSLGSSFDISGPRYSIGNIEVVISNDDRLQDEELIRRLDGGAGSVYVWCEGLDWTDIDSNGLIRKGIFQKNNHTKNRYSFSLVDQTKDKFKELPGQTINADTWPNHRTEGGAGSVAGKVQPLVFGDWSRGIPLLCVDDINFKYLAMLGYSESLDSEYTATTENVYDKDGSVIGAGNYTFYPAGADGLGNIVGYFDFTEDQVSNEPLSCSIKGKDDGSGKYTGTAGDLIEHLADIVYCVMDQFSNLDSDDIHLTSIKTLKQILPAAKCATYNNASVNGFDLITRLLSQFQCAMLPQVGGGIGVMGFDVDAISIGKVDGNTDIVGDDPVFSKTREDLICNNLKVQYGLNPATGQYEGEFVRDRTNNPDCKKSYYEYGERPQVLLQLPDIQDEAIASLAADRFLQIRAFRHDVVSFAVPWWIGWDFLEGDAGELTLEDAPGGWIDERCLLLERKFNSKTVKQQWWKIST